ncbi:hypothetical protein WA158_000068 [Blastocystis sp. Blastoise]
MSQKSEENPLKKNLLLVIFVYVTMTYFGVAEGVKGVTLPTIKEELGNGYDLQGVLLAITGYGYVIFCIIATYVQDKLGSKVSFTFGFSLCCIGCILCYFASSFITCMLGFLFFMMGFGFFEISLNYVSTGVFNKCSAIFMNLMHFFYGLGAILGPWFASLFITLLQQSFHGPYIALIVPTILLFFFALFMNFKAVTDVCKDEQQTRKKEKKSTCSWLSNKYVWILGICLGVMELGEFGAMNWGGLYFKDLYGYDPTIQGASFVSIFYGFFTFSRLISGFWIEKVGLLKSLYISCVVTIIILAIGFSVGEYGLYILPISGFFLAIMWPTLMCYAMTIFEKNTPIASSVIIVISGALHNILQLICGFINQYIGYVWGYRSNTIYMIIPIIMLAIADCNHKKDLKEIEKKDNDKNKEDVEMQSIEETTDSRDISQDHVNHETPENSIPCDSSIINNNDDSCKKNIDDNNNIYKEKEQRVCTTNDIIQNH